MSLKLKQLQTQTNIFKILLYMFTINDLSWTVKKSRWGSLWFWIGELYRKLEAKRQISCHEEAADKTQKVKWKSLKKWGICSGLFL